MNKYLKWTGITVITIIVLFVLAAIILANTINPNRFKPLLIEQVYNATGRKLSLTGNIHWAFFPSIGFKITQASLANADGFGDKPFAKVDQAEITVKLLPLLSGHIQTGQLIIDGLTVNLMQNKAGGNNWTFQSSQQMDKPADASATTANSTKKTSSQSDITFNIPQINIKDSAITWTNQKSGQTAQIQKLNVQINDAKVNEAFPVKVTFMLSGNNPRVDAEIHLDGKATINKPKSESTFNLLENLHYVGQLSTEKLTIAKLHITKIKAPIELKNSVLNLSPVTANLYQGDLSSKLNVNMQLQNPIIQTKVILNNVNTKTLVKDMTGSNNFRGTLNLQIDLVATGFDTLVDTLEGHAKFNVKDGALSGINVAHLIAMGRAMLKQESLPADQGANETLFDSISGSADIDNGIAKCGDLVISSSLLDVKGYGSANLVKQYLDFNLDANLAGNAALDTPIPLTLTGPFNHIRPDLNKEKLLRGIVKQQFNKQINRLLDKVQIDLLR